MDTLADKNDAKRKNVYHKMPDHMYKNDYVWADDPDLAQKMQEKIRYNYAPNNL